MDGSATTTSSVPGSSASSWPNWEPRMSLSPSWFILSFQQPPAATLCLINSQEPWQPRSPLRCLTHLSFQADLPEPTFKIELSIVSFSRAPESWQPWISDFLCACLCLYPLLVCKLHGHVECCLSLSPPCPAQEPFVVWIKAWKDILGGTSVLRPNLVLEGLRSNPSSLAWRFFQVPFLLRSPDSHLNSCWGILLLLWVWKCECVSWRTSYWYLVHVW